MPVDQTTYERFVEAEAFARSRGLSLVELLDGRQLLLTPVQQRRIEAEFLADLIRRYEVQSPNKLLSFYRNEPSGSAADMFAAVQEWLEVLQQHHQQGTLTEL